MSVRDRFEIPPDVTYLNCAYLSPNLDTVRAAGQAAFARTSKPWTIGAADFFSLVEDVRELVAGVMGADAEGIALVPSVSYGVGVAAANLEIPAGGTVVALGEEFPSNVYPWRAVAPVVYVERPNDDDWTSALIATIDDRTAVVAVPHCHWTDGTLVDLEAVAATARDAGAALVVDVSQSLGALPLDLDTVRPDFVVTVAYKWLLGPYGLAYLWAAPHRRDGRPLEHTWIGRAGSEDFSALVRYRDEFRPGARRYDVGETSNFVTLPMAAAALRQVAEWGPVSIQEQLRPLTDRIATGAAEAGYTTAARRCRAGHLIGLRRAGGLPDGLAARLVDEKIFVSVRGDSIRVAPHLYNDECDVDRLVSVLAR